jgi:heptosyltransferase-1
MVRRIRENRRGWPIAADRVVLVRLSALGDIVHTWPLAVAIRAARPHVHLTWVVEAPFRSLIEGHPAVDLVLTTRTRAWRRGPFDLRHRAEIGLLRSRLHELQPDLALDAQGLVKSALVTWWSGAQHRIGLDRPWRRELIAGLAYTATVPGSSDNPHVVATNLALAATVGGSPQVEPYPPDGRWLAERAATLPDPVGDVHRPRAVLLPGAGHPRKVLAPEILAQVATDLARDGCAVVVAWGPGEEGRASDVVTRAGAGVTLAPSTDLLQLTRLLSAASVVVGGDTGPVHLAASLGVPTVAVFLASDARRNAPLGPATAVIAASEPLHGQPTGSARSRPSREVGPEEITTAARALLVAGGGAPNQR